MNNRKHEQLKRIVRIKIVLKNIKDELIAIQEEEPYVWPMEESTDIYKSFDQIDLMLGSWATLIQTRNHREEPPHEY